VAERRARYAMIHRSAGNWVNRGEPAGPKLARLLAVHLGRSPKAPGPELLQEAAVIHSMVEAEASEVQVASYLRSLEDSYGVVVPPGPARRTMAVALWHVAKASLTRDRAIRLLADPPSAPTSDTARLSDWLAERLLRDDPRKRPD
jgi:hypothetical protein